MALLKRNSASSAGRYQPATAVWAGLLAGVASLIIEMVLLPMFRENTAYLPMRLSASIFFGAGAALPAADFDFRVILLGFVLHFLFSFLYAFILTSLVHRLDSEFAMFAGAIFGFALYFVKFHGLTLLLPWFDQGRNWIVLLGHMAFGIVAAGVYAVSVHTYPKWRHPRLREKAA